MQTWGFKLACNELDTAEAISFSYKLSKHKSKSYKHKSSVLSYKHKSSVPLFFVFHFTLKQSKPRAIGGAYSGHIRGFLFLKFSSESNN